jgi:hypothetical protein
MQETELQYTERLLREMIAEASAAEEVRANEARAARAKADRDKAAKAEAILARAARPFLPRATQPALSPTIAPAASIVPEVALPAVAEPALAKPAGSDLLVATKAASPGIARRALTGIARHVLAIKPALPRRKKTARPGAAKPVLSDEARPLRFGSDKPATAPAFVAPIRPTPPKVRHIEPRQQIDASRDSLLDGLFPVTEWQQPPKARFPRLDKKSDRRSDLVFAALGITLGLICALFPWYIFFNQDQFGVQAIKFGGSGTNAGRVSGGSQMENAGQPLTANDVPDVDLFATGTLQDPGDPAKAPGADEQPFPADPKFRMVHVANGRAMIEDDAGLWIVQRGSKLPDSSLVSSIEQRGGKWVMVTSTDQVIELSK